MPTATMEERVSDRESTFRFHRGQWRAWQSAKRFILVLAGLQSGKTVMGPHWLYREIRTRGPGDYLVVTPTYPLLARKALPEFKSLFIRRLGLGEYKAQEKVFVFSEDGQRRTHGAPSEVPTQVFFSHASDPESLESATAKAAWLDEAGQKKFRLGSWESIQGRLSIAQGRVLITTTPYDLGWLYTHLWKPWKAAGRDHPYIDVVRFDSTENPAFPPEELERARQTMPLWRFNLRYRGIFTRPAGQIYDCFDDRKNKEPARRVPERWRREGGLDFGGVNTAAVMLAEELSPLSGAPTGRWLAYREYHPAEKRTPAEHAEALLAGEPRVPTFTGGASSEDEWRAKFCAAGIPVSEPPVKDVEVGIDTVYQMLKEGKLVVADDLVMLLDEFASYSREVDEHGQVTEKIDSPHSYHLLDALRYACLRIRRGGGPVSPSAAARSMMADVPWGL